MKKHHVIHFVLFVLIASVVKESHSRKILHDLYEQEARIVVSANVDFVFPQDEYEEEDAVDDEAQEEEEEEEEENERSRRNVTYFAEENRPNLLDEFDNLKRKSSIPRNEFKLIEMSNESLCPQNRRRGNLFCENPVDYPNHIVNKVIERLDHSKKGHKPMLFFVQFRDDVDAGDAVPDQNIVQKHRDNKIPKGSVPFYANFGGPESGSVLKEVSHRIGSSTGPPANGFSDLHQLPGARTSLIEAMIENKEAAKSTTVATTTISKTTTIRTPTTSSRAPFRFPEEHSSVDSVEPEEVVDDDVTETSVYDYDLDDGIEVMETPLCKSYTSYIYPKRAQNKNNKYRFIINDPSKSYIQAVRIEQCFSPGESCSLRGGISFAEFGIRTVCRQKYTYKRLLALDEAGEHVVDVFKFPTCCVCFQIEESPFTYHTTNTHFRTQSVHIEESVETMEAESGKGTEEGFSTIIGEIGTSDKRNSAISAGLENRSK